MNDSLTNYGSHVTTIVGLTIVHQSVASTSVINSGIMIPFIVVGALGQFVKTPVVIPIECSMFR